MRFASMRAEAALDSEGAAPLPSDEARPPVRPVKKKGEAFGRKKQKRRRKKDRVDLRNYRLKM